MYLVVMYEGLYDVCERHMKCHYLFQDLMCNVFVYIDMYTTLTSELFKIQP